MRLAIRHLSRYLYDRPVHYALQRLLLRPQSSNGQTVVHWSVSAEGVPPHLSYTDGLGNHVDLFRHERNTTEIVIVVQGEVQTHDTAGVLGETDAYAPEWVFLRETALTRPGDHLKTLAASLSGRHERLELLHELMAAVHEKIAFRVGATGVATDAETALACGEGVCQDHAHVFIAAARLLGIPARYVSGYLLMDNGVTAQTASHAWAGAYVEGLGWVGFDPANNVCPDERYVRLAAALDYRGAMPASGVRTGHGAETLEVEIDVARIEH